MEVAHPWLGRFVSVRPISAVGGFRLVSARDARTARPVVVVVPKRGVDLDAARVALARFHHAHSTIEHPVIAPAIERSLERDDPFVVLDVPADVDLSRLLELRRSGPLRGVGHAQADAFIFHTREALTEAAKHPDPRDGGPTCIGSIGYPNLLFARDGRHWLVGLGHNVAIADEHGRVGGITAFAAYDVAFGARATPIADYIAVTSLGRALISFSSLAPILVRIATGTRLREDFEMVSILRWFETHLYGVEPSARPSVEECVAQSNRIRAILDMTPDLDGFRRAIVRVVEDAGLDAIEEDDRPIGRWRVAPDASWLEHESTRIDLSQSESQRRILSALVTMRTRHPGECLSVQDLVAAGWPGERVGSRSGANRVYVAISALRRKGLGRDLESLEGGYRLGLAVRWDFIEP